MFSSPEEEIYQEHILEHYEDPYHRGRCPRATHAHEEDNPLCGDFIHVELHIDPQGVVREAYFDGEGCCISQAAASMLMEQIEGKTVEEVEQFRAEDMLRLFGVRLTPNRQKCCLLSWKVVQQALYSPLDRSGKGEGSSASSPAAQDDASSQAPASDPPAKDTP